MAIVLGIIIGLMALFFLNGLVFIGPLVAGLISGIVAKGPVAGLVAGLIVAVVGTAVFSLSPINPLSILTDATVTGFVSYETVEPMSLAKTIFGITSVAVATISGFVGGLLRN